MQMNKKIGKRKEEKLLVTLPLKDNRNIFGVYISNVFPVYVYTHTHTPTHKHTHTHKLFTK